MAALYLLNRGGTSSRPVARLIERGWYVKNMPASGHNMTYNQMCLYVNAKILVASGWPLTLISVGDCLEDTVLYIHVLSCQSLRGGAHAPPPPTGLRRQ